MSFRQRMDAAYGRRGGRLSEWVNPPRPTPHVEHQLFGDEHVTVIVTERLSGRRCRCLLGSGHTVVVADSLLTGPRS